MKLVDGLTPAMESIIREVASAEPPPRAKNMKDLQENCQGWILRVLAKLVQRGVVSAAKLAECQRLQEPIKK